jgi:hypothetical protein
VFDMIAPEWRYAPLLLAIGLIAVLSNITALERIYSVYKVARGIPLDGTIPAPNRHAKKG